jgi:LysM repeat protein
VKKFFCVVLSLSAAAGLPAQSLRGSQSSVQKMYTRAVQNDLDFFYSSKGIYESVRDGELKLISITNDLTLEKVSYPFVLPRTLDVLNVFAKQYRTACGERLVVTSAARPRNKQPRNASPKSVHPTGMAIDFRRPTGPCLTYLRQQLVALEKLGILEATEERRPVHFHVAVLQRGRFAPAAPSIATATTPAVTAPTTSVIEPATTTDSASGTVEPAPVEKPAAKPAPKQAAPSTYTVRKGDNLSVIAKRFGLSVTRLKALNGIRGSAIRPGQKLKVR